jgi:putative FmdB family regulatory protein
MPVYEYEHIGDACESGKIFEVRQVIHDLPLNQCPTCRGQVRRLIPTTHVQSSRRSDRELRDLGFTKLVRKDEGLFENVTAREGESRIVDRSNPETFPHLHKTIRD